MTKDWGEAAADVARRKAVKETGRGPGRLTRRSRPARSRDPLEPLTTVSTVLLGLIVLGFAAGLAVTVFGNGSILGFGRAAAVCADVGEVESVPADQGLGLEPDGRTQPGVSLATSGLHLCADRPSTGQRLWYGLELLPTTVLLTGGVLLVFLLVRNAARHGIYTGTIAGRLRGLGWFLLVATLAQTVVVHLAASKLLGTMIASSGGVLSNGDVRYQLQWSVLLTGIGILTFARIMRIGVTMHEDLEGTV